jgi:hypothetical protein
MTGAPPDEYRYVRGCVNVVASQLKSVGAHCEVEARLGRVLLDESTGRSYFRPGVDEDFAARLLCELETSDVWSETTPWVQSIDRFYLLPTGLEARTTTSVPYKCGQDVIADPPTYKISHIIKTVVSSKNFKWGDGSGRRDGVEKKVPAGVGVAGGAAPATDDAPMTPIAPYDIRVSVKREEPVFATELQERVDDLNMVRVKHRKQFLYTSTGEDKPSWSIDITLVWQSHTFLDAIEALQQGVTPSYEVEVECMRPLETLRRKGADTTALSLLLKTADLFLSTGLVTPGHVLQSASDK